MMKIFLDERMLVNLDFPQLCYDHCIRTLVIKYYSINYYDRENVMARNKGKYKMKQRGPRTGFASFFWRCKPILCIYF